MRIVAGFTAVNAALFPPKMIFTVFSAEPPTGFSSPEISRSVDVASDGIDAERIPVWIAQLVEGEQDRGKTAVLPSQRIQLLNGGLALCGPSGLARDDRGGGDNP